MKIELKARICFLAGAKKCKDCTYFDVRKMKNADLPIRICDTGVIQARKYEKVHCDEQQSKDKIEILVVH